MCGIAGIFNLNGEPASSALLRKMTDSIAHRGPDSEGFFIDSFIGLGHRRLAIIDLSSAGHQPMVSQDGQYAIVYNGEVYNFQELKAELESMGFVFNSRTDTEVVLNAYIAWGEKALTRFNGMFAFAIWDKKKQELFLARDRYGIKPLYYTIQNNTFLFGSEIKAILTHPAYKTDLDREGLLEYMTFQNFFTDKTLFKGIRLFPAASFTRLQLGKSQLSDFTQYWDYDFSEPSEARDESEYLEELDRLFQQAVKRQLVSDVELGTYLSGGLDSGSITALAALGLPYIKTFTCGFDLHSVSGLESSFDEREKAEYMSYLFKTEHYELVLKSGDMQRCLPKLVWHLEEPRVGQSYPNFYVSQLASKFVKVILTGTGGDELFGGYPWRYYRAVVNDDFEDYVDKYYDFWQRLIPNAVIQRVFKPVWRDVNKVWTLDIFRDVFKKHAYRLTRPEDYVQHSLYFEAKTFLHGLLIVEDKLSMAYGLETRVPFLDNDLVDFAMKLPAKFKLGNLQEVVRFNENEPGNKTSKYLSKTNDGKILLRKMMSKYIPKKVTEYVKQGFSAPDASWFKGESLKYVKEKLFNQNARLYEYMDRETVQELINDHLDGKCNRRLLVWSLLNIEEWCSRFLQ
ncbi:MAG: asparagine synthase (glutamine-hydrolyzing) [Candidatus Raymondbacteria bacterium RifOxyA12_full_50_37]|uniref:asparagine synthase (glutamine-hydrolyzing) n=1 Tax=Candidatus Raymondbacteria bacterium RIFOXYD12_FULL_49_13 TaxID=1817890 RepID=A0A1F7F6U0_UNCRA|nr:MAG: asparagine synthase (glutamine-hydrolyzing) [Candidatus Raymondbacteria bacterium RifOxyA12_full_50_37]OGJ88460.1 MAG: asparagine synthase (glutamine-hydrolyzing) [Candidatus Raymondbacteria bacterium RIFOXYA2_FULL_49_16]OGJ98920.1 MAG: asparagine synthase (glutamine-hydrolyzing) [Candidatus Raymondbacteria bacterium RIFOXYC2_FULL_50_21]OGK00319.1 MAG: asparagine synthase (glutamine-hydrolyzing) [Candidatus Raymondbacteria bacterium RifOxyB12_full_50_8]OGK02380.1 MAG: asparagine synthas